MSEYAYNPKNLWIGNLFLADDCFEEPEFFVRDKSKSLTNDRWGHRTKELGKPFSAVQIKNQASALARLSPEGRDAVDAMLVTASIMFGGLKTSVKWNRNAGDKYGERPGFQILADLPEGLTQKQFNMLRKGGKSVREYGLEMHANSRGPISATIKDMDIWEAALAVVNMQASDTQVLEVEFLNGGIYQYSNVDQSMYNSLMSASSHGSFFGQNIRRYPDTYPFTRVQ